jgi:hypothetical protein
MNTEPIPISETLTIPWPSARPFDIPLTSSDVKDVWNTIVKPLSDSEATQSLDTRCLMAIVRAVYWGMHGNVGVDDS